MSSNHRKGKIFLLVLSIFIFDQITKFLALKFLAPDRVIKILPFFNLVYIENTGTAFGMFKFLGSGFFIGISFIAICFLLYMTFKDKKNWFIYALIIAGAIGNVTDRIIYGYVIDFIDIHVGGFHWPAFNIADSAISIGIVLFIYQSFKK